MEALICELTVLLQPSLSNLAWWLTQRTEVILEKEHHIKLLLLFIYIAAPGCNLISDRI